MKNYHKNLKTRNPIRLNDPEWRQRREATKKQRLNKLIEEEARREIREAKKTQTT